MTTRLTVAGLCVAAMALSADTAAGHVLSKAKAERATRLEAREAVAADRARGLELGGFIFDGCVRRSDHELRCGFSLIVREPGPAGDEIYCPEKIGVFYVSDRSSRVRTEDLGEEECLGGETTGPPPPPVVRDLRPCIHVTNGTRRGDRLTGGFLGDTLNGLAGADTLKGRESADCLNGGDGDDELDGGGALDTFSAGAGDDVVYAADGIRETVRCGRGRDVARADPQDRLVGCERVMRIRGR